MKWVRAARDHEHGNTASIRSFLPETGVVKASGVKRPIKITKYSYIAKSPRTGEAHISAMLILI